MLFSETCRTFHDQGRRTIKLYGSDFSNTPVARSNFKSQLGGAEKRHRWFDNADTHR